VRDAAEAQDRVQIAHGDDNLTATMEVAEAQGFAREWIARTALDPDVDRKVTHSAIANAVQRLVPHPDHSAFLPRGKFSPLLAVLAGHTLYRVEISAGDHTAVTVEPIDLVQQRTQHKVTEERWIDRAGNPWLKTTWSFEFDSADNLTFGVEEADPIRGEGDRLNEFGGAIVVAATELKDR
jgi:hypothetical protein